MTCPYTLIHENGKFFIELPYEKREIAKKAGFQWDSDRKHWATNSKSTAKRLIQYADPLTRRALGATPAGLEAWRLS